MQVELPRPVHIFVDNNATVQISANPIQPGRNLHVHARYFFIRDLVYARDYDVNHIRSAYQLGDILVSYKGEENFSFLCHILRDCARVEYREGEWQWDMTIAAAQPPKIKHKQRKAARREASASAREELN